MKKCSPDCKEIHVLHAAPVQWIPSIVKNGFQHTKLHPERASYGRGSGEDDIIFFERFNTLGVRYALSWMVSLEREGIQRNGIVEATICSCHFLDASTLHALKNKLSIKGTQFIMDAHSYPESRRQWALDHFGARLEFDKYYNDPMSFLRKIANDSDHMILDSKGNKTDKARYYGIGEVMDYLGYDAADGYTGSHAFSPDRDEPMNEIIVSNPAIIHDIKEVNVRELTVRYACDEKINKMRTYLLSRGN